MTKPIPEPECMHGHKKRVSGCVSCELLNLHSTEPQKKGGEYDVDAALGKRRALREPQKDETTAERENREAHALLDTMGIPRHDDAGHYKLFGRITLLKAEPKEPHAALIAELLGAIELFEAAAEEHRRTGNSARVVNNEFAARTLRRCLRALKGE